MGDETNQLRQAAYTTTRPDVFLMVPAEAQYILDVGCSNGALGASLRAAALGRRVTGIEYDAELSAEARTRLDCVIQADLNRFDWEVDFSGQYFDCIIFSDVLEHLVDPEGLLEVAQKYLKVGGCFVISLPNIRHVSALLSIFGQGTFPRRDRGIFDRTHLRWFTIQDARRLLSDVGMLVEDASYSLRVRDRGDGLANKLARKLLGPLQAVRPVHEFLAYQFCLRAVRR